MAISQKAISRAALLMNIEISELDEEQQFIYDELRYLGHGHCDAMELIRSEAY